MKTYKFAVIGHPLGHTMSPFIHRELFKLNNIDAEYDAIDIPPQEFQESFARILHELDGFNVTIPYKPAVIPLLDSLSETAEEYGSVNTVKCADKSGSTTDPMGFLRALEAAGIALGGKVAILGAGGVCRVFSGEAARAGCDITFGVLESDIPAAMQIQSDIKAHHPDASMSIVEINSLSGEFDLLINATPVGMYPRVDAMPVSSEILRGCAAVFDAVYNPENTALLKAARAAGCKTQGGMTMLVEQAAASQEIWLGVSFKREDIDRVVGMATENMNEHFKA